MFAKKKLTYCDMLLGQFIGFVWPLFINPCKTANSRQPIFNSSNGASLSNTKFSVRCIVTMMK